MNMFWVTAAVMLVFASLFIIVPTIRHLRANSSQEDLPVNDPEPHDSRTEQNVLIYKDRLAELENDLSSGAISQATYNQLKTELDGALVEDADTSAKTVEQAVKAQSSLVSLSLVVVCLIVLVALSMASYLKYGAYEDVASYLEIKEHNASLAQATEQAKNGDMSLLLEQLHEKLKEQPNNIEGWSLLARTALNTERYTLAVKGFKEVIKLLESQTDVSNQNLAASYGILAQSQYYAAKGSIDSNVKTSVDKALSLDSGEPNTLSLLAIDTFTSSQFNEAISYWSKILAVYPNHPAAESMRQGINEAQRRAGLALTNFSESKGPSIDIEVKLSDTIANSVNANDTLFIIVKNAQAGDQPSPPLAASRHLVAELPITINLSDSNAMSPMAKLSDASTVDVVARISKSGNVMSSKGDFEGYARNLTVQDLMSAKVEIDTLIE